MNLKKIRDTARYRLNDYEKPYTWLDEELNLYANEAQNLLCREGRLIPDSTTSSVCTIAVKASTLDYLLDESVVYVTNAKLTVDSLLLVKYSKMDMDQNYPDWRSQTAGQPTKYILDYRQGYITLHPPPDTTYTLTLSVLRYPLADMALDADEPEIAVQFHHALVDGICYQAFLKRGEKSFDMRQSDIYLKLFARALAEMKKSTGLARAADRSAGPHRGFI